jgi:myo-inositol-1(or 4)-monophosphatase
MSTEMNIAKKAALKAGKALMALFEKKIHVEKKEDNSFVTEADKKAEKIIIEMIAKKYPSHSFYSEEEGKKDNKSDFCWYIDPLDGTHNYIYGLPFFAVSIALAKKGEVILGVIYVPYTKELFYAEKGNGAFLNKKRISVSKRMLEESMYFNASSFVHQGKNILKMLGIFIEKCKESRMIGSCAIELSYIAAGRAEFKVMPRITAYDIAAGKIILEEAGGKMTGFDNRPVLVENGPFGIIASNGKYHDKLIKIVGEEFLK